MSKIKNSTRKVHDTFPYTKEEFYDILIRDQRPYTEQVSDYNKLNNANISYSVYQSRALHLGFRKYLKFSLGVSDSEIAKFIKDNPYMSFKMMAYTFEIPYQRFVYWVNTLGYFKRDEQERLDYKKLSDSLFNDTLDEIDYPTDMEILTIRRDGKTLEEASNSIKDGYSRLKPELLSSSLDFSFFMGIAMYILENSDKKWIDIANEYNISLKVMILGLQNLNLGHNYFKYLKNPDGYVLDVVNLYLNNVEIKSNSDLDDKYGLRKGFTKFFLDKLGVSLNIVITKDIKAERILAVLKENPYALVSEIEEKTEYSAKQIYKFLSDNGIPTNTPSKELRGYEEVLNKLKECYTNGTTVTRSELSSSLGLSKDMVTNRVGRISKSSDSYLLSCVIRDSGSKLSEKEEHLLSLYSEHKDKWFMTDYARALKVSRATIEGLVRKNSLVVGKFNKVPEDLVPLEIYNGVIEVFSKGLSLNALVFRYEKDLKMVFKLVERYSSKAIGVYFGVKSEFIHPLRKILDCEYKKDTFDAIILPQESSDDCIGDKNEKQVEADSRRERILSYRYSYPFNTDTQLAKDLGCSLLTVQRDLKVLGLENIRLVDIKNERNTRLKRQLEWELQRNILLSKKDATRITKLNIAVFKKGSKHMVGIKELLRNGRSSDWIYKSYIQKVSLLLDLYVIDEVTNNDKIKEFLISINYMKHEANAELQNFKDLMLLKGRDSYLELCNLVGSLYLEGKTTLEIAEMMDCKETCVCYYLIRYQLLTNNIKGWDLSNLLLEAQKEVIK